MTWVAWRQQRYVFWAFALVTVVLVGWALMSGLHEQSLWNQYHSLPCRGGNGFPVKYQSFCQNLFAKWSASGSHNNFIASFGLILAPLVGVVLGVGAVASELERKTARLAWTQSLTRTRWLAIKVLVGVGSMAVLLVPLCFTFSWWVGASRYAPRVMPTAFPFAGWMLGIYGVFAFAVVVFLGVLIRRAGWTIAVGLAVFGLVFYTVEVDVRSHLAPMNVAAVTQTMVTKGSAIVGVTTGGAPANGWLLFGGYRPLGSASAPSSWSVVTGRTNTLVQDCEAHSAASSNDVTSYCLHKLGLEDVEVYVSDHQFWTLQLREGGLYLVVAMLLLSLSAYVLRRIRI
jgi:hypothetical protein